MNENLQKFFFIDNFPSTYVVFLNEMQFLLITILVTLILNSNMRI